MQISVILDLVQPSLALRRFQSCETVRRYDDPDAQDPRRALRRAGPEESCKPSVRQRVIEVRISTVA
jgi:hypothetical protein